MSARSKARKRALDVLFESEQRGVDPLDTLVGRDDVPDAVVIDQAVELARSLSTDDSPAFVNGLLGRLVDLKPMLAPDQPQA